MKPIGVMKSLFQFKNGTPRQASICSNAPGVLTIEKSVFNNPSHSLEGLEDYSHAWIIFVFHKNNNSYTKAKVKPPRLDGKRTGVFSSRSPYRPNNIGLSLVKIDKIEGATVYLSGVDMIDGTPVLDIKPYIPEYDYPISSICSNTDDQHCVDKKCDLQEQLNAMDSSEFNTDISPISDNGKTASTCMSELEKGFLAMSSSLDRASDILTSKSQRSDMFVDQQKAVIDSSDKNSLKEYDVETDVGDSGGTDLDLDIFLENVLSHAVDTLSLELPLKPLEVSKCEKTEAESTPSLKTSNKKNLIDSSSSKSQTEYGHGQKRLCKDTEVLSKPRESNNGKKSCTVAHPVVAPWLHNPPVKKLKVTFTIEALQQLQHFSKSSQDPHYRLQLLSNAQEAESAISGVLHEEPRSVYRRQHCQDSLYFFTVDVIHVTCWFDEDVAQVVRVKPVAAVSKLQDKLESGIE